MVILTYPHIENIEINPDDEESSVIQAQGLVIPDLPLTYSNFSWKRKFLLII
ncbi:MAG: carbamoyl-phosphate synthase domain-containing protein [Arsenophonus sp. NC-TX2-MAG3]